MLKVSGVIELLELFKKKHGDVPFMIEETLHKMEYYADGTESVPYHRQFFHQYIGVSKTDDGKKVIVIGL